MIWWFSLSRHSFSHFLLCPLNSSHTEVLSFLKTTCCALYNFQAFGYTIPWEREWCFLVSLFDYTLFILLAKLRHQFGFEIRYQQREERKRSALPSPSFVFLPLSTSLTLYIPTTSSHVILYRNAYLLVSSLNNDSASHFTLFSLDLWFLSIVHCFQGWIAFHLQGDNSKIVYLFILTKLSV